VGSSILKAAAIMEGRPHVRHEDIHDEWRTALTNDAAAAVGPYESPLKREYWEQPASKLRRLESEAPSPARVGSTAAE